MTWGVLLLWGGVTVILYGIVLGWLWVFDVGEWVERTIRQWWGR